MGEQVQSAITLVERVLNKVNEFNYKSFPEFVIALESNKFTIARKVATEEEKQLQNLQNKLEEHLGLDWKKKSAEDLNSENRYEELTKEEWDTLKTSTQIQTISNIMEKLLGGIRVYARIRNVEENRKQVTKTVESVGGGKIKGEEKTYGPFTEVFSKQKNEDVYKSMKPTFDLLATQNVLLMSFGVSGSGKTYTFFNQTKEDRGVILRYLDSLNDASIDVSVAEIYGSTYSHHPQLIETTMDECIYSYGDNGFERAQSVQTAFANSKRMVASKFATWYGNMEEARNPPRVGGFTYDETLNQITKNKKPIIVNKGFNSYHTGYSSEEWDEIQDLINKVDSATKEEEQNSLKEKIREKVAELKLLPRNSQNLKEKSITKKEGENDLNFLKRYLFAKKTPAKRDHLRVKHTTNNPVSSRSHLAIRIKIKEKYLTIVDCAGQESEEAMLEQMRKDRLTNLTFDELKTVQYNGSWQYPQFKDLIWTELNSDQFIPVKKDKGTQIDLLQMIANNENLENIKKEYINGSFSLEKSAKIRKSAKILLEYKEKTFNELFDAWMFLRKIHGDTYTEETFPKMQSYVTDRISFYLYRQLCEAPFIRMTIEHLKQALVKFADPSKSYLQKYATNAMTNFISNPCFPLMHYNKSQYEKIKNIKKKPFQRASISKSHNTIAPINLRGNLKKRLEKKPRYKFIGDVFSLEEAYKAVFDEDSIKPRLKKAEQQINEWLCWYENKDGKKEPYNSSMIDLVNASVGDKGKIVIFNMVRDDEADEVYKSMEFANSLQLITKSPELDSVDNAKYPGRGCNKASLPEVDELEKPLRNFLKEAHKYLTQNIPRDKTTLKREFEKLRINELLIDFQPSTSRLMTGVGGLRLMLHESGFYVRNGVVHGGEGEHMPACVRDGVIDEEEEGGHGLECCGEEKVS